MIYKINYGLKKLISITQKMEQECMEPIEEKFL